MHSHFGLQLRLALARVFAEILARRRVLDTWSSSTRPVTWPHSRLTAIIPAQPCSSYSSPTSSRGCACRTRRRAQSRPTFPKALVSITKAARNRSSIQRRLGHRKAHPRPALHRLRLELGAGAELRDQRRPRRSACASPIRRVGIDIFRVRAVVVVEQLEPDRDGRLPRELGVIAGTPREAAVRGRSAGGCKAPGSRRSRRRAAAAAGGGRRAWCGRAAPSRGRSAAFRRCRWRRSARR